MGNPGNETDRRNLHINRRDSRSTHARGSLLKSSAKAEKIKRIFEFCQHRQERAQSLSPSKLEALDCLLFKIIVTSLLFLFVWGSHCIACQATGAARHRVVFLFSPPGLFSSPFSAQIISIAIYSHPLTLLQLHLLLNPSSMDLLFQVLYFSVLELPFFKNTIFVSLLRFHIWFTLYDLFFKSQYVGIFIIVSLKKKRDFVCSNIWITSGLFQLAYFFLEYWSDLPFAFTYLLDFDWTQDILDHVLQRFWPLLSSLLIFFSLCSIS